MFEKLSNNYLKAKTFSLKGCDKTTQKIVLYQRLLIIKVITSFNCLYVPDLWLILVMG